MYLLAHTGITLGLAEIALAAWRHRAAIAVETETLEDEGSHVSGSESISTSTPSRVPHALAGEKWFYAVILIGALLPDMIDKPLGMIFIGGYFSSGRTLGHTLLFALLVFSGGLLLYRARDNALGLVLSAVLILHYLMDEIWSEPQTFWWPLLGSDSAASQPVKVSDWLGGWQQELLYDPQYYVPEAIGFLILMWFLYVLLRRRLPPAKRRGTAEF